MAEIASLVQCGFNPQQAKHIAAQIGWCDIDELWAYASASTITVPTDATTRFQVGDKIRLTQTTVKYFYVIAVAATTITLSGGSDYTVSNEAISSIAYSRCERPFGFPQIFAYTGTPTGYDFTFTVTSNANYFEMKGRSVHVWGKARGTMSGAGQFIEIPLPVTSAINSDYNGGSGLFWVVGVEAACCRINLGSLAANDTNYAALVKDGAVCGGAGATLATNWNLEYFAL